MTSQGGTVSGGEVAWDDGKGVVQGGFFDCSALKMTKYKEK